MVLCGLACLNYLAYHSGNCRTLGRRLRGLQETVRGEQLLADHPLLRLLCGKEGHRHRDAVARRDLLHSGNECQGPGQGQLAFRCPSSCKVADHPSPCE